MRDRVELAPKPTRVEFEAVMIALAEARLLGTAGSEPSLAWRRAGLEESVERVPQALVPRSNRGAMRA